MKTKLAEIKPGKNYPSFVKVTEETDGKTEVVKFMLESYYVGMYCAIYFSGRTVPIQVCDHDNCRFMRALICDLKAAVTRGAQVEIGELLPVKTL